jgi:hypothetical protein
MRQWRDRLTKMLTYIETKMEDRNTYKDAERNRQTYKGAETDRHAHKRA